VTTGRLLDLAKPYYEDANLAVLRQAGIGKRVLDVGCGRGRLGAELKRRGNTVHGIEMDPDAAAVAATRLDLVHRGDATDFARLPPEIRSGGYDAIVLADVLEHIPDSLGFLRKVCELLRPEGRAIVSLPNVAVWPVRLSLALGDFTYADSGILDRTHLRFFTRATANRLLADAGLRVVASDLNPCIVRAALPAIKAVLNGHGGAGAPSDPAAIIDSPAYRAYARWIEPVEAAIARLRPELLAFQIVLVGVRAA